MGLALPAAHRLGRAGPVQSRRPGGGLCDVFTFGAGLPEATAERGGMGHLRPAYAVGAAALARHGADPTLPTRYVAQPVAERRLSGRLGTAADGAVAREPLLSAGSALQHTIPQLHRRPRVARLSDRGNVADQCRAAAGNGPALRSRPSLAESHLRCGSALGG